MPATTKYDESFFTTMDHDALRSASDVLKPLRDNLDINSVVDFGCGTGIWLHAWQKLGCQDVTGIDGDYVSPERLVIPSENFLARDLQLPLNLNRRFDLVQSLEVAEHLPATHAQHFVNMLCDHGDLILFSAATPGQMGIQHVNEQPYSYWRDLFARRGYALFDWLRPQLQNQQSVAYWYRYNTLLFVHESKLVDLPAAISQTQIPDDQSVPDLSPLGYRARCAVTRMLPVIVVDQIIKLLHSLEQRSQ